MEMEGRGCPDFYWNTSEELFIKTMMESSTGMPAPTMETLGFKNISQSFRTDSEELFKSWLTSGENTSPVGITHRTRTASRRISTELSNLPNHQYGSVLQKRKGDGDLALQHSTSKDVEHLSNLNPESKRNAAERGLQATNLYLAKAWFHSSQPMTRSRSSELRRRYASMQNSQTPLGAEAMMNGLSGMKQEYTESNGCSDISGNEIPNQINTFMSPSNSSSSTFMAPQVDIADKISSVVTMLKGTLERKKLSNQIVNAAVDDGSLGYYGTHEELSNMNINQGQGEYICRNQGILQDLSVFHLNDSEVIETVEGSFDMGLQGIMAAANTTQMKTVSQEPSQSESSAAAPVVSAGFDVSEGPSNSCQAPSICESSRKQVVSGRTSENSSAAKDIRGRIYGNLKGNQKKGGLVRSGSVTSGCSVDNGDPTKKRRVERSRKMAEAKERNSTPAIPVDMQSVKKRCENLEKEVRSLKLNLAFMNRKDSEQTKEIEELQKKNEELSSEKERLLEEIERIIADTGGM